MANRRAGVSMCGQESEQGVSAGNLACEMARGSSNAIQVEKQGAGMGCDQETASLSTFTDSLVRARVWIWNGVSAGGGADVLCAVDHLPMDGVPLDQVLLPSF